MDVVVIKMVFFGFMYVTVRAFPSLPDGFLSREFLGNRYKISDIGKNNPTLDADKTFACCPSIKQRLAPFGGLSRGGSLLQLYRDSNTVQTFYETACAPDVRDKPCKFIDPAFSSRCAQQYTYTYAIVKDFNVTQPYRFDLMKIKSGCSCTVGILKVGIKGGNRAKRHRHRHKRLSRA